MPVGYLCQWISYALWGIYPEAISVICYSGGWAVKEAWWPRVLKRMSALQGQAFRDACDIFFILNDYPEIHAGLLKDQLSRTDQDQNDKNSLFRCLSELNGWEEMLDYFGLDYRDGWKLLMDDGQWADWKQEHVFAS